LTRGVADAANPIRGHFHRFLTDPNGGVGWTKASVDALTAGLEVMA